MHYSGFSRTHSIMMMHYMDINTGGMDPFLELS